MVYNVYTRVGKNKQTCTLVGYNYIYNTVRRCNVADEPYRLCTSGWVFIPGSSFSACAMFLIMHLESVLQCPANLAIMPILTPWMQLFLLQTHLWRKFLVHCPGLTTPKQQELSTQCQVAEDYSSSNQS